MEQGLAVIEAGTMDCKVSQNDCPNSETSTQNITEDKGGEVNLEKKVIPGPTAGHQCEICERYFTSSTNLRVHLKSHSNERPYKCDICDKTFKYSSHFSNHKRNHSGIKSYSCPVCGKAFFASSGLLAHAKSHSTDRPYKCDICSKMFKHSSHLTSHKNIHSRAKEYVCGVCGKVFTQSSGLLSHQKVHTNERPFKCDVCEKSFKNSSHLTSHKKIHTGRKDYSCNICGKKFRQSSAVGAHQRVHTGERPYKCDLCEKTFKHSSHLSEHRLNHSNERLHKCHLCDKSFNQSSALLIHRKSHLNERPYKCDKCEKTFKYSSHLSSHRKKHASECYQCTICYQFVHQSEAYIHVNLHAESKLPPHPLVMKNGIVGPAIDTVPAKPVYQNQDGGLLEGGDMVDDNAHLDMGGLISPDDSDNSDILGDQSEDLNVAQYGYSELDDIKRVQSGSSTTIHHQSNTDTPCTGQDNNKFNQTDVINYDHHGSYMVYDHTAHDQDCTDTIITTNQHGFTVTLNHEAERPRLSNNLHINHIYTNTPTSNDETQLFQPEGSPFTCTACKKSFTEQSVLSAHEKVCAGAKTYKCKRCGKCFTELCNFLSHQRGHLSTQISG